MEAAVPYHPLGDVAHLAAAQPGEEVPPARGRGGVPADVVVPVSMIFAPNRYLSTKDVPRSSRWVFARFFPRTQRPTQIKQQLPAFCIWNIRKLV